MNSTIQMQDMLRKGILFGSITAALLIAGFFLTTKANAAITSSLDFGSTGPDVTQLQTYLATNSSIYPSGLVTGYFGALTQAGVQRFQAAEGIVSSGSPETTGYGRVGPQTRVSLNARMGSGTPDVSGDAVPVLNSFSVQYTSTTATFSWNSNEVTQGQVYYDSVPLRADEATAPRQQTYVSGSVAVDTGGLRMNHAVTVTNLQPNTLYYYLVRGTDSVGNVAMIWPSSFRTNP